MGLHLFLKKSKIYGLENIPKNKPVLFLPNHQNALVDALLIGTNCTRKPYFLTRSDVFVNPILKKLFYSFKMIPVYRMRDGRDSLKNNEAVFNTCANLLCTNEAVLMFPEANHSLVRRVRPLSKGFTRVLFAALEKKPKLDIYIVPVGVNYKEAIHFPDKAAIYYGKPIQLKDWYNKEDLPSSISKIKNTVSVRLKLLTIHIDEEGDYEHIISKLETEKINFLNPDEANQRVGALLQEKSLDVEKKYKKNSLNLLRGLFNLLNLPVIILWKKLIKPKVPEAEFIGTFRFVFGLLIYPLYYGLLLFFIGSFWDWYSALALVGIIFMYNYIYVKLG